MISLVTLPSSKFIYLSQKKRNTASNMAATTSSSASTTNYFLLMIIFSLLLPVSLFFPFPVSCEASGNTTLLITVDLIHRYSPHSPLYNSSQTPTERFHNSIKRSFNRAASITNYVQHNNNNSYMNFTSHVSPDHHEYLMKFSIGTPPLEIFAMVDTSSDLIWTQCKPCHVCYKQTLPIFNPANSSTYKDLTCASQQCQALLFSGASSFCEGDHNQGSRCDYSYIYSDGSFTAGYLANETLTFDSANGTAAALPGISFGCGHNNRGEVNEENMSGVVGLATGPLSLISQLGATVDWKFSYCLVPQSTFDTGTEANHPSKLHFGSVADHLQVTEGVVSTPMVPIPQFDVGFYFVSIEGISVGGYRIDIPPSNSSSSAPAPNEGQYVDIMIDSATSFSFLPPDLYEEVEQELKRAIHAEPAWPPAKDLNLCYNADDAWKIPNITFHFTGADVELPPLNTFVHTATLDEGDEILCFAFYPWEGVPIYGNTAQINFLIEFDVLNYIVKFKKMDCTRPL